MNIQISSRLKGFLIIMGSAFLLLGLLSVFDLLPAGAFAAHAGKLLAGLGLLFCATLGSACLSASRGQPERELPPPQ